jgi:methylated-DNA-[protein]-cysteine S-methyltransferase
MTMAIKFQLEQYTSPIGAILIVADDEGTVRAIDFADYEARMHQLLRIQYGDYSVTAHAGHGAASDALAAYFEGDLDTLADVPVKTEGTAFQRDVWTALRTIPAGSTISYGQLAANLGRPKASRAVGLANGSNPISIVVPCHRVIGSDGSLTGYGGGMERKRWLLDHERACVRAD